MNLVERLSSFIQSTGLSNNPLGVVDVVEIIILAVLLYYILLWVKNTRAWNLLKGIFVILVFVSIAAIFQMNTILWIARNTVNVILIALVVLFQPELRSALENLGSKSEIGKWLPFAHPEEETKYSERWIDELVKGCFLMGKAKTGALIVLEGRINLDEYIRTGIDVDALLSSQLLINIFEKNTPLHDGAVIVRDERILSATCYLPLSESLTISKDLGTRHRAALGISEVSDSITIVVSEETGRVSVAVGGTIETMATADDLKEFLRGQQQTEAEESAFEKWIRRFKNGEKDSEYSDQ